MYAFGLLFPFATNAIRGDRRAFPFGTHSDACMSLPCNFWSCFNGACFWRAVFQRIVRIFVAFSGGSEMHLFISSNSHPRISFEDVHLLLSRCNFFIEIGSSSFIPVSYGGGKI